MPKRVQPSKFQFVKSFFQANPSASAEAAAKSAAKSGLDISIPYARQIRSKSMRGKKAVTKAKPRTAGAAKKRQSKTASVKSTAKITEAAGIALPQQPPASADAVEPTLEAVRFIKRLGGIDAARAAIDAGAAILREIQDTA